MDPLSLTLAFVIGAVVGSFLNVVALRFNTGVGLGGRSRCMSCAKELTWKELIPLFSFFWQKGSCKKCKSKISWQYPIIEFLAGVIFVLIFFSFPPISALASFTTMIHIASACLLLVIVIYDIKHKIIPDMLSYSFAVLALANLFIGNGSWWQIPSWSALLAGPILALPFALLWFFSKGAWMGLGDAKLVLGIGWFLGIGGGLNAIILAFWIAAVVSVAWILISRKKFKPRMEVPFGPYLILGMYLVLLFGVQVIDVGVVKYLLWG